MGQLRLGQQRMRQLMGQLTMRRLFLIALLLTATYGSAQRMISGAGHSAGAAHRRAGYFTPGFFPYYDDTLLSSGPAASQAPTFVLQPPPTVPERPPQPLMIELRGDHYVRVNADEESGVQTIEQAPAEAKAISHPASTSGAQHALDPVVLIFRDGRREEVSGYTIAGGDLYARADFYTDGSWNRKIALSALNLPDTVSANRSRGISFQLPTAPNEVIVRP